MTLQTRGSVTLDKAQRRLANLKSIEENLDLGHGLTIAAYTQMIAATRAAIEAHNTLVSKIDESRRNLTAIEKALSEMSTRMLSGVATKYGKSSTEYSKAGGSIRKSNSPASSVSFSAPVTIQSFLNQPLTNGSSNGTAGKRSLPN